jgi:hypothetical protein
MSTLWKFAWVVTPRTPHLISQILRIGPSAKLVSGEASPVAQLVKVIRLDRFACCGLELYDMMAIAEENAGYGDRSAPVRDRSAKFSITALVMHPPIHRRILCPLPATALIQVKFGIFKQSRRSPHSIRGYFGPPVFERAVVQQPAHRRSGRYAAAFHLAVAAAASFPPCRHNATSGRTRAVVRFDASNIAILEDKPYPRRAAWAGRLQLNRGGSDFAPGQLRIALHRVRCPYQFGEIPHQLAPARLGSPQPRQRQ